VKLTKLSDLKLDTKNANKGTDRGRKLLKKSLEELGIGRSILVDRAGHIIAGNKTAETLAALKQKKIRVIQTDGEELVVVQRTDLDINSAKARKLAVADNRVAELDLNWDIEALKGIDLGEFFNDAEMRKLGITTASDEGPAPQLDRAAELQAKWKTERGQIWEIGEHRLMCGDSGNIENVKLLMNGKLGHLLATDPPYVVDYKGGSHPKSDSNRHSTKRDKDWSESYHEIEIKDFTAFITAFITALKPDSPWYVWHASKRQAELEAAMVAQKIRIHQQIIWKKTRQVLTYSHFMWQHEPCLYGWLEGSQPEKRPPSNQPTVWEIGTAGNEDAEHPTQKPIEIFAGPLRWHLGEGEIACEPFSGSGTQLVAAEKEKRICYAMEIEPKYVAVALERMADMGLKPKLAKRSGR
jgi:DNA modification methylase